VAVLFVALILFFAVGVLPGLTTSLVYLLLLLTTFVVVRSVPVEPGAWLGRRLVRRCLVLLIALLTVSLLAVGPETPSIQFMPLLVLALCLLALGRATRRIASANPYDLDERQETIRNTAHRIAYAILAPVLALTVLIANTATPESHLWLSMTIRTGGLISFFLTLFFLPAMVVAWIEPDRIADESAARGMVSGRTRLAYALVALCVALPLSFSLALPFAPIQTTAFSVEETVAAAGGGPAAPLGCRYFEARKQVGFGYTAVIPISADVCWDGVRAYENWGLNSSDCLPRMTEMLIATVSACRRTTGADGSLRFLYRARLRPALLPFVSRDVDMNLAVDGNGQVVQFP
jgi:hypothetical protein